MTIVIQQYNQLYSTHYTAPSSSRAIVLAWVLIKRYPASPAVPSLDPHEQSSADGLLIANFLDSATCARFHPRSPAEQRACVPVSSDGALQPSPRTAGRARCVSFPLALHLSPTFCERVQLAHTRLMDPRQPSTATYPAQHARTTSSAVPSSSLRLVLDLLPLRPSSIAPSLPPHLR